MRCKRDTAANNQLRRYQQEHGAEGETAILGRNSTLSMGVRPSSGM